MGRENDGGNLSEIAESRGLGALPESPSEAIEIWEGERSAPAVSLSLEYGPSPRVGWGKLGALAVLGALVLWSGRKAVGR
jgi:hypothetical protein